MRRRRSSSQRGLRKTRQICLETLEPRQLLAASIWDGGGDGRSWLDHLNWADDTVPPTGADVTIPNVAATTVVNLPTDRTTALRSLQSDEPLVIAGGTLSLDTSSTLGRLTISSGTLAGTGDVTVTGVFDWRSGSITSSNPRSTVTVAGGLTIASGTRTLSGRTMVLASDTQWTAGDWRIGGGATIENRAGSLLSFGNTFLDDIDPRTTDTLINAGTLRKSSGTTTATFQFDTFDLRTGGRVESLAGTLSMVGSITSAGHWEVTDGASIDWNLATAQSQLRAGTTSAGLGSVRLVGGTLSVTEPVTLDGLFIQNSGTIDGAATLTLAGPFQWNGGTQLGTGQGEQTVVAGGLTIASGARTLSGRTMVLASDTQWTAGDWRIGGGATIENRAGSLLSFGNTFLDDIDPNATDTIINEGTLRKSSGTTTATFQFDTFDLRTGGRVESLAGTLSMVGSITSAGHWEVADGASIDWNLASAQSQLRAGTTSAGLGSVRLVGGTLSVTEPVTLGGLFIQNSGTIEGTATLTLAGPFQWNGGTQSGTGQGEQTVVAGGLTIASGARTLSGRTMVLASDTLWTGGDWRIGGGATIENRAGSVLSFGSTFLDDIDPNTTDSLVNEGTLQKFAESTSATFQIQTVNNGAIVVSIGELYFTSALIQQSGSLTLAGGNIRSGELIGRARRTRHG